MKIIPEELVQLSEDLKRISHELWEVKRDLAWNRVIDDAVRVCHLLGQWEAAEARKFNPNWRQQPRHPKRTDGAGQWAEEGGGDVGGDVHLVGARGSGRSRPPGGSGGKGSGGFTISRPGGPFFPGQQQHMESEVSRAEAAARRAQEFNPNWRPKPEAGVRKGTPQETIDYANRVEAQANAEISRHISHNSGQSEPTLPAGQPAPQFRRGPFDSNLYRRELGLPDRQGSVAKGKDEGTVAYSEVDGRSVFGVNSSAGSYTEQDRATANQMRDALLKNFPGVMKQQNKGWKPNDFLYHAEVTLLLRAGRERGGSLSGMTIEIQVDRDVCLSCIRGLPYLGLQLGNPTVRFRDPSGRTLTMRNGRWMGAN